MTAPAYDDVMPHVCMEQGQINSPAPCILQYRVAPPPPLCVCVCVCVEHENVSWSLNCVGTSQSFIIFALFFCFYFLCIFARLAFFFFLCVSLCASCFLFMTNLTICLSCCAVFSALSLVNTQQYNNTRLCHVCSLFSCRFLYSVSKYYCLGYTDTVEEGENLQRKFRRTFVNWNSIWGIIVY